MSRIRTIKPEFFRHTGLYDLEAETKLPIRIAFAGLWTVADREGRFIWAPRVLKLDCLPHDNVEFSRVLDALITRGFLVKYASDGRDYGWIPSWNRHQFINNRESPSILPPPPQQIVIVDEFTRSPRVIDACPTRLEYAQGEGEGEGDREKEREERETEVTNLARASRLPENWTPLPDDRISEDVTARELEKFRDYWKAKPGKDGRKLDWQATWRNWCRRAMETRGNGSGNYRTQKHGNGFIAAIRDGTIEKLARGGG